MSHIEWVGSNMKGGCDVQLGLKTVIIGDNGAGKSTIVQAAELATRGMVSDMEGRDVVKLHTALARLFPEDPVLSADCRLSNGTTFSWRMERKGESFKSPVHGSSDATAFRWPVQELQSILSGDVNSVAAWLEEQVVGKITQADLLRPLDPEVREHVEVLAKSTGANDFMKLAKEAKDTARTLRAAATKTEKTVEAMIEGVNPPLLAEERAEIEASLAALAPAAGTSSQRDLDVLNMSINQAVALYKEQERHLTELAPVSPELLAAVSKVQGARDLIQRHVSLFGDASSCWVCGSTNEVPNAQAINLEAAAASLQDSVQQHAKHTQMTQALSGSVTRLQGLVARRDAVVVAPDTSAERDGLVRRLAADDSAQRTWRNAKAQRAAIAQDREKATHLSKASKALAIAGKELLESKKQSFIDAVSAYLPPGETLGVDLDTARVGLLRGDQLHSALSGAEWSRLMLAIASVWVDDSTPCVLVPQDRAWDSDTLSKVMVALKDSPVQVIIMSTVSPAQVEGWTFVHV